MKKVKEAGTPTKILLANIIVFSRSLCSKYEKEIVIMLISGSATINPAKTGFFKESQLANEIIRAEKKILAKKITIC